MNRVTTPPTSFSLRWQLIIQFSVLSFFLIIALSLAVHFAAERAARTSQDAVLGAGVISVADGVQATSDGIVLDLPYATFSLLGAGGNESLYYSVRSGTWLISGYDNLPEPPSSPGILTPVIWYDDYKGSRLRFAAVTRRLRLGHRIQDVSIVLGQTRYGQNTIAHDAAHTAAWLAGTFMILTALVAFGAMRMMLRRVDNLALTVSQRGPQDLSPVCDPTPRELLPLVIALNGFSARLHSALKLAETFLFEAAHRIRTPLSLVRVEAEVALSEVSDESVRLRLRRVLRAISESSRSANQVLDHAMVVYRSDSFSPVPLDFAQLLSSTLTAIQPIAEMREIEFISEGLNTACPVFGDERMLEVALRNLLDNALKYSYDESRIFIHLMQEGDVIIVKISDEGRGLSDGDTNLIDRFKRGSNASDVIGSGLGLTMTHEVAVAHGGQLTLKPRMEKGVCATLSLPLSSHSG